MRVITYVWFSLVSASRIAQSGSGWRVTQTFPLGGDGSSDYIVPDPPQHRVFIGRQTRVIQPPELRA